MPTSRGPAAAAADPGPARGFVDLAVGEPRSPVVWFVPDGDGTTLPLAALATALTPAWTVRGLESPFLEPTGPAFSELETLALRLASIIRRADPGPYRLVGFGLGACVAFEVARQLVAGGAVVASIVFVDGGPGRSGRGSPVHVRWPGSALLDPWRGRRASWARHARLVARYRWEGRHLTVPATVVWSADVPSLDGTLGWAPHIGDLTVVHRRERQATVRGDVSPPSAGPIREALESGR